MFRTIKRFACATAVATSLTLLIPVVGFAQDADRDHHDRDWANNSYYQMGSREGSKDFEHHHRKTHKHKFRSDDDRRAYAAGYDNSWQGNQDRDHRDHDHDTNPH